MKSKQNFLEWNNNVLVSSLKKINANILLIVLLDALFYIASGYLFMLWFERIQSSIASFNMPADIISLGPERAQQLVSDVRAFYFLILISFVLLLIAIIFLASMTKGIIWAKTAGTKITFSLISKFLVLNLIWMGFWLALFFTIFYLVQPALVQIFIIVAIILSLYLTNTLYTLFIKEQKLKVIFASLKLNISKIHLFLLPYSVIGLLLYVIIRLGNLINSRYSQILLGLTLIVYASIVRYYASGLVLEIDKL
ncbi:hypothetical protein HYY71_01280 [Candidatus Woesearchaeota archaeon]|nr:hypothetical protein [Candidatus Woesearchaeota archaeon]